LFARGNGVRGGATGQKHDRKQNEWRISHKFHGFCSTVLLPQLHFLSLENNVGHRWRRQLSFPDDLTRAKVTI
jgi:hypothetical protein